jgi:hypothetical protein
MINSKSFYSLMMIFAFTGSLAAQECVYPALVEIPDGATAAIEDMITAQGNIQQFVIDMTAYQDCINVAIEVAGTDATIEFKAIMDGRFNAAATEIEAIAAAFNEQIVAFRAANP